MYYRKPTDTVFAFRVTLPAKPLAFRIFRSGVSRPVPIIPRKTPVAIMMCMGAVRAKEHPVGKNLLTRAAFADVARLPMRDMQLVDILNIRSIF